MTVQTSKIPTYERMWNYMDHNQEVFVDSTKAGLEKVLQDNYAFLLESTMNEYVTQRNCDLMQVGGLLDAKGYGIGTPRGELQQPRSAGVTLYWYFVGHVPSNEAIRQLGQKM